MLILNNLLISHIVPVGQTMPNLDHLGLAFQDLGIDLQDLGDYVRNVESVPCSHDVPQYPLVRETHLNFLKPGSHEVVHRPVHVHEHLPPMHPDLEGIPGLEMRGYFNRVKFLCTIYNIAPI